ncbi:armadillo repeat-containing protein LFR [Cynara cardunculus var. scolymus]|uniref:Armadillo-like helical n=1 Tax=Cynara cardunculus var. scolymus TaxID=59895 RepID=A0A103XID0_CYNCS|nr:armadillo repeat-containing protein LFR [Cynara cardunculus var. scolymus]XP_024996539.1 armadillo repeat-containing protein LFR [Cynara cardunculus var. scolymus]KVH91278.1 Armadillo-like helical [Cynara cardunculus var. scolymus]
MQKRELGKQGGGSGGSGTPAAKRGRPFGSTNSNSAAALASDAAAPSTLLGPSLQVHSSFADQNNKRIVLALQSGLKSELTWALNTLTLLSFKEKDEVRKDATPLAKIPGLLDALLQVIDDWRDIALPKELIKNPRTRSLGANSIVTGFGNEYKALGSNDVPHPNIGSASVSEASVQKKATKSQPSEWWLAEDGLFNLDDEGRAEKQQCAVAASNILRNFSFMPENEVIMGQHRHCLETIFQCMEDHVTEDEELVTNCLETIVNLAPLLDLRIFSSSKPSYIKITEKRAVQAIMGILGSAVKVWHCAAAELLGRLIINPENEPFLLPSAPQIYKRLVDLLSLPAVDAQAAAVGALYNLAEVNMDCRLKLASERWAVDRLLKVIKAPHPVPEVCRKAAMILESLVSEPQNRPLLLAYENAFAEILFSDGKYSDTFARILFELTSKPNSKVATARGIWGM